MFVLPEAGWHDGTELDICTIRHLLPTDDGPFQLNPSIHALAVGDQLMHEQPESTIPSSSPPKHRHPPANLKDYNVSQPGLLGKGLRNVTTSRPSDVTEGLSPDRENVPTQNATQYSQPFAAEQDPNRSQRKEIY